MPKLIATPVEPTAVIFDLPKDYTLVPKGNVFITKHCRSKTHAINRPVFVVHNYKDQKLGIGVPKGIHEQVLNLAAETADTRARAVEKKDSALETKTKVELMKQFPKVPKDTVPEILNHMLKKHSGRVGRTSEPLQKVVALGVRAHIRHKYTGYDKLLKEGIDREAARKRIHNVVDAKVQEWGGKPWSSRVAKKPVPKHKCSAREANRKMTTKLASHPKRIGKA